MVNYVNTGKGVLGSVRRVYERLKRRMKAFFGKGNDMDRLFSIYDKLKSGAVAERGPIREVAREGDQFRDQTDTPEFKKWFGDSKVVDANGKPLVVYHGTKAVFTVFDINKIGRATDTGMWGRGFYFSENKPTQKVKVQNYMKFILVSRTHS